MPSKKRPMGIAKRTLLSISLSLVSGLSFAKMYQLPEDGARVIGRMENHVVEPVSYTHLTLPTNREV